MTKDQQRIKKQAEEAVKNRFRKWEINPFIVNELIDLYLDGMRAGLQEAKEIYNNNLNEGKVNK